MWPSYRLAVVSSLSLDVGSFQAGSSLFINSCSAISCDFGALTRGDELKSFYSTLCLLPSVCIFKLVTDLSRRLTAEATSLERDFESQLHPFLAGALGCCFTSVSQLLDRLIYKMGVIARSRSP